MPICGMSLPAKSVRVGQNGSEASRLSSKKSKSKLKQNFIGLDSVVCGDVVVAKRWLEDRGVKKAMIVMVLSKVYLQWRGSAL